MKNCEGEVSAGAGESSQRLQDCRNLLHIIIASERVDFLWQLVYGLFISSEEWFTRLVGKIRWQKEKSYSLAHVADESKARI